MTDFKTVEALRVLMGAGIEFEDAARLLEKLEPTVWDVTNTHPVAEVSELECVPEYLGWRIVVLQRGWVVVGDVSAIGTELVITDARVIRKWGTTKGLGELVDGPTAETVLDEAGTVRAHALGVVLTLDTKAEKWDR